MTVKPRSHRRARCERGLTSASDPDRAAHVVSVAYQRALRPSLLLRVTHHFLTPNMKDEGLDEPLSNFVLKVTPLSRHNRITITRRSDKSVLLANS